jgi:SAM-dependent methyltransferase
VISTWSDPLAAPRPDVRPWFARVVDSWLGGPSSPGSLDASLLTAARAGQLRSEAKRFLCLIYAEWADRLAERLPSGPGGVLEVGSGAGLLAERVPGLIRSDVLHCPGLHLIMDARQLALESGSLRAIVLCNVLHHVPDVESFLHEAARCLRPGGALLMLEPWVTAWSSLVWRLVRHEPFEPASGWELEEGGDPLARANVALPWILFERDWARLQRQFPTLLLRSVQPLMPFRYLLSGGFSRRALAPAWSFAAFRRLEEMLSPWMDRLAMFAQIELLRVGSPAEQTCQAAAGP